MSEIKSAIPGPEWDQQLQQMGGHFLQSQPWAQFQLAIDRPVVFDKTSEWMWMAAKRQANGIRYLYASYGPVIKGYAGESISTLIAKGRELKADFVRLEPVGVGSKADIKAAGGKMIAPLQPKRTWILELRPDEDQLRSGLASGHRNLINGTERRGIKIYASADASETADFLAMLEDTAARAKILNHPDWYYRKLAETLLPLGNAKYYVATHQGKKVAMALVYDWGRTRYYAHAGAYQEQNRELKASVSLVWQAILDAKTEGKAEFDFFGIAPTDDPNHPWAGLTRFKTAFGGQTREYNGTWDIPLKPLKYKAYSLYRRLKGRQDG